MTVASDSGTSSPYQPAPGCTRQVVSTSPTRGRSACDKPVAVDNWPSAGADRVIVRGGVLLLIWWIR